MHCLPVTSYLFFFNDPATTEIYTLSLHDALPIYLILTATGPLSRNRSLGVELARGTALSQDRKSTRLNSSHTVISYAVFCLKKKKEKIIKQVRDQYTGS